MCTDVSLLQNVLGSYSDFQKMNFNNEQMYGVAEMAHSSVTKSKASQEGLPLKREPLSHPPQHKRDKVKKKHRDPKPEGTNTSSSSQELPHSSSHVRKKASVRPYKASQVIEDNKEMTVTSRHQENSTNHQDSVSSQPRAAVALKSDHHPTSEPPTKQKKVKKAKKRKSSVNEDASQLNKYRPEALNLPYVDSSSTPGHSDVPDTGDVRNMLKELLNPTPLSVVTPLPTPSKVQPFFFPSISVSN